MSSSAFHEELDEQSPLLTTKQPDYPTLQQPQATTSQPATPPIVVPSPQPSPVMSSSNPPTPPPPETVVVDRDAKGGATTITTTHINPQNDSRTPVTPTPKLPKASTNIPWGAPAGLAMRGANDEMLLIFRRAVGINSDLSTSTVTSLEAGRRKAVGVYADILRTKRSKAIWYMFLNIVLWLSYFFQIIVGAGLTALGPGSASHPNWITGLGVLNTVIAGFLALVKGQGLPERLRKDEMEFRRLQDWIEETEALLAVGVIGRDRKEVGLLVEMAFKRFNAAKMSEENNRPESYVPQAVETGTPGPGMPPQRLSNGSAGTLNVSRY
ncbi:hypothetical protein GE09DRAFT_337783 [Coniochaeta sp. 2T2.1]|nr:hypothetical protein GE09DRAFT_337783 [Coniochaeta sp. 2T2.1]